MEFSCVIKGLEQMYGKHKFVSMKVYNFVDLKLMSLIACSFFPVIYGKRN